MLCFVDYRTTDIEIENLKKLNLIPLKIPKSPLLYEAIDGHVDIQLAILNRENKKIIVHKDMPSSFLLELEKYNVNYIFSENSLTSKYPNDISLNVLISNSFIMHNLKYTDKNIISNIKSKELLNVSQGYTKCSVLPINDNTFITSDAPIHNLLIEKGFNSLLVPPGDIELPPLEYGFIGGVGGMIDNNTLALFGEIDQYKYKNEIINFLSPLNINIISLKKGKLTDRGSLLLL